MNILNILKQYGGKWTPKGEAQPLTDADKEMVLSATVVPSDYGASVCLLLKNGNSVYIPCGQDASYGIGETLDVNNIKILTLSKQGQPDIYRAV